MLSRFKAIGHTFCRTAPWALAIGLNAGCTVFAPPPPVQTTVASAAPPARPQTDAPTASAEAVTALLTYADRTRALSGTELTQEITRLGTPPLPTDQLRLAIALSQTRQFHDLVRAQELLQRVLANTGDDARPLHAVARLLSARFVEQRRVEDVLDRQNQQLRDLQKRLEQTQDKLDALKEIERSLSSRPPPAPAPSPNGRARPPGS